MKLLRYTHQEINIRIFANQSPLILAANQNKIIHLRKKKSEFYCEKNDENTLLKNCDFYWNSFNACYREDWRKHHYCAASFKSALNNIA